MLSMDYGTNCDSQVSSKWYFDLQTRLCFPFEYTGCGQPDSNRFDSIEQCQKNCIDNLILNNKNNKTSNYQIEEKNNKNKQKEDEKDEYLKTTTYFTSSTESYNKLNEKSIINEQPKDICDLPMLQGNCSQHVTKWFYDRTLKYCRPFEFSGCKGNENRFETRHQCIEICETRKRAGKLKL